jgi:hypothetical protein
MFKNCERKCKPLHHLQFPIWVRFSFYHLTVIVREREREILPNIVCLFSSSALMLEEIAEIEEKNPQDMINDKMVNFQKRHLIGEVLCKLQRYQSAIHRFCH